MGISAPFGFVPLSDKVVCPEWLQPLDRADPSDLPHVHDIPFEDGICGTIQLELTAETPIFIRGSGNASQPFALPDGRYAIPGSALRGALRNVIEIATFGRFSRINDHRYSIRALTGGDREVYASHMAALARNLITKKDEPMPLVQAGWLRRESSAEGDHHVITPCDFAKVEYQLLKNEATARGIRGFDPDRKQAAVDKYKAWGNQDRNVRAEVSFIRPDTVDGRRMLTRFGKVGSLGQGSEGVLVFTGQPSRHDPHAQKKKGAGNPKHHDFVFLTPKSPVSSLTVSPRVFSDFTFGHSNRGQQNSLHEAQSPNTEWAYWKEKLEQGEPVPVFFLTEGDRLRAFGLAMMFRLPYELSIGRAVGNASVDHGDPNGPPDLADGLFGMVRTGKSRARSGSTYALKGRVGIGHAIATADCKPLPSVSTVLAGPKASYFPIYVEQSGVGGTYKTWMDQDAVPAGWKRYRTRNKVWTPPPPTDGQGKPLTNEKVMTTFCPLPADTRFRASVDVHNLKPEELGALLWALDFGGEARARHGLGMARPLGYGKSKFTVLEMDLRDMQLQPVDPKACIAAFEGYMDEQLDSGKGAWRASPQVEELVALAIPVQDPDARYMRLSGPVNEFLDAKKGRLSLKPLTQSALALIRSRKVKPRNADDDTPEEPARVKTPPLVGYAAILEAWFVDPSVADTSSPAKRDGFDVHHAQNVAGLEDRQDAAACLKVVRSHISENKKSKDWLAALPGRLGL